MFSKIKYLLLMVLITLAMSASAEEIHQIKYISTYDGDTIKVKIEIKDLPEVFSIISVRLRGIDSPEIRGNCPLEIEMAHFARDNLAARLETAEEIYLLDVKRDKYFRLLANVIADGEDIGTWLLEKGLAVSYPGYGPKKNWCKQSI